MPHVVCVMTKAQLVAVDRDKEENGNEDIDYEDDSISGSFEVALKITKK